MSQNQNYPQQNKRKRVSFDSSTNQKKESVRPEGTPLETSINSLSNTEEFKREARKCSSVNNPPIIQRNINCTFHDTVSNGIDNKLSVTNITNNYNCTQYSLNKNKT
jgi:hypothetical protein